MTERINPESAVIADCSDMNLKLAAAHRHFFVYRDDESSEDQKARALSAILALWTDLDGTCPELDAEIDAFLDFEITPQGSIMLDFYQ